MKRNVSFRIVLIGKARGPSKMNQHKSYKKLNCIKERPYYQFGGITKSLVYFELLPISQMFNSDVHNLRRQRK